MRPRLVAASFVVFLLALALGLRLLNGQRVVDSSGALSQFSGTALYAAMMYAGVFVLRPRTSPVTAAVVALGFCWAVELFQLTGVPAYLSARSVLARLALGVSFDPKDESPPRRNSPDRAATR
jgi:hypothetical protein